jgi:hypothetical protein
MPTPERILAGLTAVANEAFPLAVAWHAVVLAATIFLLAGWRPSRRLAGALLAAPLTSVSALAFAFGNPFNGAVFALLFVLLVVVARRFPGGPVAPAAAWTVALGAAMIVFSWVYPHFLRSASALTYLIGAPMGLIPCPTLSLVIGFSLVAGGLAGRAWAAVLAVVGGFYGLFGVVRLLVGIDLVLAAGAFALGVLAFLPDRSRWRSQRVEAALVR